MPEINQRQFDWGPPANGSDGFKEWLVYFVIIAMLGVGVWVLLDINGQKAVVVSPVKTVVNNTVMTLPAPVAPVPVELAPPARFFVQLGAFADEASAKEVFAQLTADGFAPTLAAPDEQYEIHRVLVGPFQSEKEAEEKAEKLNALEFQCFVIESP